MHLKLKLFTFFLLAGVSYHISYDIPLLCVCVCVTKAGIKKWHINNFPHTEKKQTERKTV